MNQQPDKLFRDKLESYQKGAPTSVWDKIAASQGKKKTNSLWLKVAASLLIAAGVGLAWMLSQSDVPVTSPIADRQSVNDAPRAEENKKVPDTRQPTQSGELANGDSTGHKKPEPPNDLLARQNGATPPSIEKRTTTHSHGVVRQQRATSESFTADNRNNAVATRDASISTSETSNTSQRMHTATNSSEASSETQPGSTVTPDDALPTVSDATKSVTLTYTTSDVSTYLNKNIDGEATDDDKKQSTLKKLLQKANDLKTNQDPFGELRQRKNEILALNFINDKRGQKTRN